MSASAAIAAMLFVVALRTFLSNDPISQQCRLGTKPTAKVSFQGLFLERGHRIEGTQFVFHHIE
jgi:hypothetical protein